MTNRGLTPRIRRSGLDIFRLVERRPRQLVRSGTSVGATYRVPCRAPLHAKFIATMGMVEEEAIESGYWLEMLTDAEFCSG